MSLAYRTYLRSHDTPGGILTSLDEAQRAAANGEQGLVRPLALILCALVRRRVNAEFGALCKPPVGCHLRLLPFFAALGRKPTDKELDAFVKHIEKSANKDPSRALADAFWALLNSSEFIYIQ